MKEKLHISFLINGNNLKDRKARARLVQGI